MIPPARSKQVLSRVVFAAFAVLVCQIAMGQQSPPANWTAEQDHQNMMDQLGIKALRPGPSGNEKDPDHANYDEVNANPYGGLPDALTLKTGQKVTSAEQWWKQRRPEIIEDFEREVVGRIPPNVPAVNWTVKSSSNSKTGATPAISQAFSRFLPSISVPSGPTTMGLISPCSLMSSASA